MILSVNRRNILAQTKNKTPVTTSAGGGFCAVTVLQHHRRKRPLNRARNGAEGRDRAGSLPSL